MRKDNMVLLALIGLFVLAIVAGGWYVFSHNTSKPTSPVSAPPASSSNQATTNQNVPQSQTSITPAAKEAVTIENMAFSPATLTIKKGTIVTWTNKDAMAHTVTENDDKTGPDSGTLDNGATYSYTFTTVGTYQYHCAIHSQMTGTVVVTD